MRYIQASIGCTEPGQREIITALLADAGYEGFEETEELLLAFIPETAFNEAVLAGITATYSVNYSLEAIEQQNWNAEWESSFEPVIINDFAAVRAGFHAPVYGVQYEVVITPKMSFGTGHHATTYLMMQQMAGISFSHQKVFDFGTGTGVLAILAEKMGASAVDAIDNDDWSIENTKENTASNGCYNITAWKADTIDTTKQYDVVLANINLNVLLAHMKAIAAICKPGAMVLFSGILVNDAPQLKEAAAGNGLVFNDIKERNGWLCIKAHRS